MDNKKISYPPILVVEDETILGFMIKTLLENEGFQAETAPNGADAIEWVKKNPNSLLLLDYQLPDIYDTQIIDSLSADGNKFYFIGTTGHDDESIANELMKMGAQECLIKNSDYLDMIIPVVKRIMEKLF